MPSHPLDIEPSGTPTWTTAAGDFQATYLIRFDPREGPPETISVCTGKGSHKAAVMAFGYLLRSRPDFEVYDVEVIAADYQAEYREDTILSYYEEA